MSFRIPLMKHTFLQEDETRRALADFILKADRLSMGPECEAFEKKFAARQERKFAVLFNSGGSANLAMIQALKNMGKIADRDKAGFSAITWSTNTMPLIQLGLDPVALDCEATRLNVTAAAIGKALEQHDIRLLFLTNVLGMMGDMDQIGKLAAEKNIIVLEDNCESLGSRAFGKQAGNFSLASSFSFFVAHHMSTIEGGMVCTDDPEMAAMLKIVRANGWDRNLSDEEKKRWRDKFGIRSAFEASYTFYDLGYNLRPTEITGFLGQYQLQFLDENIRTRERNFHRVQAAVKQNPDFIPLQYEQMELLSGFAFPFIVHTPELRQQYLNRFMEAGIEIRPLIAGNMQRQPFYRKYDSRSYDLPGADQLHTCGFYSGNYPELTDEDLQVIESCLKK